jgi:porin
MRCAAILLAAASACLSCPASAAEEERAAVKLGATYVTDILTVADGGIERGTAWLGRADVTASIDGRVFGIDGAELFVDVMRVNRPDFSGRFVGDAQTVSNVQADSALRPYEAWLSVPFGKLTAKAGLIDLNTEFDIQRVGRTFLNSSFGIGPDFSQSGRNGPSIFPAPATAALLRYEDDKWAARFGVFDAVAGSLRNPRRTAFRLPGQRGALLVGEVERKLPGDGEIQFGLWHYTTRFDLLDPGATGKAKSQGGYALVEGKLAARGSAALLHGWARIGIASDRTNPIGLYLGGGAAWRDAMHEIGLAIAHAQLGDPGRRATLAAEGGADRAETTIELTYARPVLPWVTVQPDLQYVINPGWVPSRDDALVVGVRFSFAVSTK